MYTDIASSSLRELDPVALTTNIMVFLGRDTSLYYWIPAFLYAALIFFLSHQSNPPGAETVPDYAAHFVEYGLFGLTLIWGATSGFREPLTARTVVIVLVISALYAISDELHQSLIPDREASLVDVTMDILGTTACVGLAWVAGRGKWR